MRSRTVSSSSITTTAAGLDALPGGPGLEGTIGFGAGSVRAGEPVRASVGRRIVKVSPARARS